MVHLKVEVLGVSSFLLQWRPMMLEQILGGSNQTSNGVVVRMAAMVGQLHEISTVIGDRKRPINHKCKSSSHQWVISDRAKTPMSTVFSLGIEPEDR